MIYSSISGRTGIVIPAEASPQRSKPAKIIFGESGKWRRGEVPIMKHDKTRSKKAQKIKPLRPIKVMKQGISSEPMMYMIAGKEKNTPIQKVSIP